VVGSSLNDATEVLVSGGFRVLTVPAPKGTKPPGVVTVQSPRAASTAPRGSIVVLEVSDGEPKANGKDDGD
jgi:beta-lactam-binding protein with PASTA domain